MKHKLKELRENNGLSQTELAKKLGLTSQHYCMIENGKRGVSLELAKKISDLYKLPIEDIFFNNPLNTALSRTQTKSTA